MITKKEEKEFNIRKLRAIEGVMITQGKKTEAIELEQLDGNKAVNLSRQIYSKSVKTAFSLFARGSLLK